MSENKGIAGQFVYLPKNAQVYPNWRPFATEAELRAFVTKIVRDVLEEDARAIQEHKAFQPVSVDQHKTDPMLPAVRTPSGICWACEQPGESAEMMWLDQFGRRSHLIHNTAECIRAAENKPEQREHRG